MASVTPSLISVLRFLLFLRCSFALSRQALASAVLFGYFLFGDTGVLVAVLVVAEGFVSSGFVPVSTLAGPACVIVGVLSEFAASHSPILRLTFLSEAKFWGDFCSPTGRFIGVLMPNMVGR